MRLKSGIFCLFCGRREEEGCGAIRVNAVSGAKRLRAGIELMERGDHRGVRKLNGKPGTGTGPCGWIRVVVSDFSADSAVEYFHPERLTPAPGTEPDSVAFDAGCPLLVATSWN